MQVLYLYFVFHFPSFTHLFEYDPLIIGNPMDVPGKELEQPLLQSEEKDFENALQAWSKDKRHYQIKKPHVHLDFFSEKRLDLQMHSSDSFPENLILKVCPIGRMLRASCFKTEAQQCWRGNRCLKKAISQNGIMLKITTLARLPRLLSPFRSVPSCSCGYFERHDR